MEAPPQGPRQRLVTPLFALMWFCGFAGGAAGFQLFPTVPYRIRELGGSTAGSGLFLGVLTYASAFSAPWTGALADFLGRRRWDSPSSTWGGGGRRRLAGFRGGGAAAGEAENTLESTPRP